MMTTILIPIFALGIICLVFGFFLGLADKKLKVQADPLVDQINELLPQTQCAQCGYPGCRPYAQAMSEGDAINKCTPGGEQVIGKLAELLNVEALPPAEQSDEQIPEKRVAYVIEQDCIGCTKCIQACPVDAIIGATRQMHTIISAECTGCELCVAPCPTDCIEMVPIRAGRNGWQWQLDRIAVTNLDEQDKY